MQKRLAHDLEAMRKLPNFTVEEVEDVSTLSMPNFSDMVDHQAWRVQQIGPPGTPYEGGVYEWEVTFPNDYPFKPPRTFLKTEIYHVNLTMANKRALRATAWFSGDGDLWAPKIRVADIFAAIDQVMVEPYLGKTLDDSKVRDAELKKTVPPATTGIQVLVKTLTGKIITVPCGAADSVLAVKGVVEDMEGIPISQQRLVFAGMTLENTRSLEDYNIVGGSVLHLVLRLGTPALDSTIDVDLRCLYTSDKVIFEATAAQCRDEHATSEFNGHRIIVSVSMPEHESGQITCTCIDGSEVFSSQVAPSDLCVGSIREAVAQQLEVASARVALVLNGEVVTRSAHDTKTLAEVDAMISAASMDAE